MDTIRLSPIALTQEAFAPFGDVIEAGGGGSLILINDGRAELFDSLATVDAATAGGSPIISVVRAKSSALPLQLTLMERHPLGSQAFLPWTAGR